MPSKFQSHAGSIEAVNLDKDGQFKQIRFNPTLVRLRPLLTFADVAVDERFQSHAGSIEARMASTRPASGSCVSIPRWFD